MRERYSLSSSLKRLNTPTKRGKTTNRKPVWIYAIYLLFLIVCLNAVRTYQEQKELVRSRLEVESAETEITYSGAEEHVVTAGVGSSQYGGSMKASTVGTKKKNKYAGKLFNGIRPEPSGGTKDYINQHSPSDFEGFSFYVMADTPFTKLEETKLRSQMTDLKEYSQNNPSRNIKFGVHLGGTQKVSECAESTYENHAYLISEGPRPTFVTPGKRDWFDCTQQEEAFGFFMKYFGSDLISRQFENFDIRHSKESKELFSLYVEGILFVGLHMVDPPTNHENSSSRDKRMKANMQWFAESIEGNFAEREIRGVVVLGHAGRSERNKKFFEQMRKYFDGSTRQTLHVLYIHGDGLSWKVDKDLSPFYDVQIDQGGLAEPCIIDVAPQRNGKIQSIHRDHNKKDSQTILGKGLFRLDQRKGRDSEY